MVKASLSSRIVIGVLGRIVSKLRILREIRGIHLSLEIIWIWLHLARISSVHSLTSHWCWRLMLATHIHAIVLLHWFLLSRHLALILTRLVYWILIVRILTEAIFLNSRIRVSLHCHIRSLVTYYIRLSTTHILISRRLIAKIFWSLSHILIDLLLREILSLIRNSSV